MTDVNTIIPTTGHNLTWKLEKIYQNTAQSGPSNGHERLTEEEARRMRFDQKLEVAEGLLMQQQQQQQLLQESEKPLKNEWKNVSVGHISTPDLPSSSHVRHHLTPVLKESTTTCSTELLPPVRMDSMQPEKSRERRKQRLIHELKHSQDYIHHPEVLHRLEDISQ
jgi:hypothetical protein